MLERIEEQVGVIPAPPIVDDAVEIHVTERIPEQIGPEQSEKQVGDIPVSRIVEVTVEVVIGNVQVNVSAVPVSVYFARAQSSSSRIVRF